MRKKIFLVMAIFTCLSLATSQAQIGVKAGIGFSEIGFKRFGQSPYLGYENNGVVHNLPKLNYEFGVYMPLEISNRWALQPELKYIAMGLNYDTKFLYEDITYRIHINYIRLPIVLKYSVIDKERVRTALYVGPYAALNMGAIRNLKVEEVSEKTKVQNVKARDVGVVTGFSVERRLSKGAAHVDLRIGYSLFNMMDPVEGHFTEFNKTPEPYARNINATFTVGYLFDEIWTKKNQP